MYDAFVYGGMGHERLRAFGKPCRTRRMIDSAVDTHRIKNYRLQEMYDKRLLAFINKYDTLAASQLTEWMLEDLNSRNYKMGKGQGAV